MRKTIYISSIILLLIFSLFAITACDAGQQPSIETYTITYIADEGGWIDGETVQTVEKNASGTEVTARANSGYLFAGWSDWLFNRERQESNVVKNITLTAHFVLEIDTDYLEIVYIAEDGGSIIGTSQQYVRLGANTIGVSAYASAGYDFLGWSDGISTAYREETNVQESVTYIAFFAKKTMEVNYSAGDGGRVSGELNQSVPYGDTASCVVATPDVGYKFVKWSDNNSRNPQREDMVNQSINAVAEFELIFTDGRGTESNPMLIGGYEQFLDIKDYPNLYYKLKNDLDLSEKKHSPLFDANIMFTGVFDGDGHTISNMTVDSYTAYPSLLGFIDTGIVKNLNLTNFEIIVPNYNTALINSCVGAVAGISFGKIENVSAQGSIIASGLSYDKVAIGGLVGQAGGVVSNSKTDVDIVLNDITSFGATSYPFNVGGLIGIGMSSVISCEAQGTISITAVHKDVTVGGLIGYLFADKSFLGASAFCEKFEIRYTIANVEIVSDSPIKTGGFICIASVFGKLEIDNCMALGNMMLSATMAAGFIWEISESNSSTVSISSCSVENEISTENGMVAGFIFAISKNDDSIFEISDSFSRGNISAMLAAGFCYIVYGDVKFCRCYSETSIWSQGVASGFIYELYGGVVEECFSGGELWAEYQASGFIFSVYDGASIKNCYSICEINITNTDTDTEWRTVVAGFIVFSSHSIVANSYYAGKISGYIYTGSKVSGLGPIVADFVGSVRNSSITNCHLLYNEDTFALDIVAEFYEQSEIINLTIYASVDEMSLLAGILNEGREDLIWTMSENGLPELLFATRVSDKRQ